MGRKRTLPVVLSALMLISASGRFGAFVSAEETDEVSLVGDAAAAYESDMMTDIRAFVETARSYIGCSANAAGSDTISGFNDVSFISRALCESGYTSYMIPDAEMLYSSCSMIYAGDENILPGSIVFYGSDVDNIRHVGIVTQDFTMLHVGINGVCEEEIDTDSAFAFGKIVALNQIDYTSGYEEDPYEE